MQNHVLDYLSAAVNRVPNKAAFVNENECVTFLELYQGMRRIGSALAKRRLRREPVLVYMEKSPRAVVALFGVICAGCYYVPLDAQMPLKRVERILKSTQARMIICDEVSRARVRNLSFDGETALCEELLAEKEDADALAQIRESTLDTDPVYVLFTSGSTGVPKGVVGHHRGVIDYIEQLSGVLGFGGETVFGNQAPLYFDACMKELYATIKHGATTYLIPEELFLFPLKLVEYLNVHRINTICWVVSAMTMISAFGTFEEIKPKYLKTIAFVGEVFPVKQFNLWREALPDAAFTNLYGPTECTGVCCYYHADRAFAVGAAIPIGRPFPNTQILLIREDGKEAAAGEIGEIYIRGAGVAHGYYNNPERTGEVFVQNPLNPHYLDLVYRTGDLARYDETGELVFVSRKDFQIKHMGHRIELGEIDANADSIDGIRACCSIYAGEDEKIVLFYVGEIDRRQLVMRLKEMLPRYMLPNAVIPLDALLYTATGKIDRAALKRLYAERKRNRRTRA